MKGIRHQHSRGTWSLEERLAYVLEVPLIPTKATVKLVPAAAKAWEAVLAGMEAAARAAVLEAAAAASVAALVAAAMVEERSEKKRCDVRWRLHRRLMGQAKETRMRHPEPNISICETGLWEEWMRI